MNVAVSALTKLKSRVRRVGGKQRLLALAAAVLLVAGSIGASGWILGSKDKASASSLALCGNAGTAPQIKHVVVVMMENLSYSKVIGSSSAPYQTNVLAPQCGVGTSTFGATHTSAANYLAVSGGQIPPSAPPGCGSVSACADSSNNLYKQLDTAGLSWKGYAESMPSACGKTTAHPYRIGHNPAIFYSDIPAAECQANDVPVANLNAQSGAFWTDLQNHNLPSFSWVTPNEDHDGSNGETAADTWLNGFITNLKDSPSYQDGNTVVLVTYDEGSGSDSGVTAVGEDCTDQSQAMPITNTISAHRESCHIPFFVVYPFTATGARDSTFFDHYSVTRTVEDLFGLPCLAHACDSGATDAKHITNSLVGHFGIQAGVTQPPADTQAPSVPVNLTANPAGQNQINLNWDASTDDTGVAGYKLTRNDGFTTTSNTNSFVDTNLTASTTYTYTISAYDAAGNYSAASTPISATTAAASTTTACANTPLNTQELSGNTSLEANQTGWTGIYNSNSTGTRAQVPGGSYDGLWALKVAPKAGTSGAEGVNNANPIWLPGTSGASTLAGQTYTGNAMVKTNNVGKQVYLLIRETTTGGSTVASLSKSLTLSDTAWHSISTMYIAKNSGDIIRYTIYASNFASSSEYFWADCLTLQTPSGS